jgi:hypothetical protein
MDKQDFLALVQTTIETATARLVASAKHGDTG